MVNSFHFARLPIIHFKAGGISTLPALIRKYGRKIALVTGKSSFLRSGTDEILLSNLNREGIEYHIISISGEPSPESIDQAVKSLENVRIDLVVAVGGGSALDAGKAISAMMHISDSIVEYLEEVGSKDHPGTRLPYIAIPTTAGTGSEATKNAVISRVGTNGFKKSLRHENFVPDIALVDPELTLNCPPELTASSGMDCFTQLTEAYLSGTSNNYTDALALEGLKEIRSSLVQSVEDGSNIEARTGMSFAALTSGICLANAGLGVVHGFASSAGGLFDIPHGLLCGTLMAKANEVNVRILRKNGSSPGALKKYATLGRLFLDNGKHDADYYIDGFIDHLYNTTERLKLPGLKQFGLTVKDVKTVCNVTGIKNNPVRLTTGELIEIFSSRLI